MEKPDLSPHKARVLAEEMFSNGLHYEEIQTMLVRRGYSETQASETIDPIISGVLKKKLKRNSILAIVILLAIIASLLLWYIGEQRNNNIVIGKIQSGEATLMPDGTYVAEGRFELYDFLLRAARWGVVGLIAIVVRIVMQYRLLQKLKTKTTRVAE